MEYNIQENTCPVPKGVLVVIGGKEDKEVDPEEKDENRLKILKTFLQLSDKEDLCVEIVTTASNEGEEMFEDYRKVFEDIGVKNTGHIHHKQRNEVLYDDLTERINKADAFFFTGGDQLLLTSLYGGSNFLTRLKERYINEKIIVAGTSAGAMALSTPQNQH